MTKWVWEEPLGAAVLKAAPLTAAAASVSFLIFIYSAANSCFAGSERIDRFRLNTCLKDVCVRIEAPQGRRSPVDTSYVFLNPTVQVYPIGDSGPSASAEKQLVGLSGYYDPDTGYIVLEGLSKHGRTPSGGAVINLPESRITWVK
jgi:hypothetical protein